MPLPRIIRNAARCLRCGDEIESKHVHDFRRCACGAIAVDGGLEYTRGVGDPEMFEDLTVTEDPT